MKPHTPDADLLKLMYRQVKTLELGPLLWGLTILAKDTATYLTVHGINNEVGEGFRLAYLDMLSDNRYYWENFGPKLYLPLGEAFLPEGFASAASNCNWDLQPLLEGDLDHEWLRAPGWHFLKIYSGQRKNDILRDITLGELRAAFCNGRNPYKREIHGVAAQEDANPYTPIEGLVGRLIGSDQEWGGFWYPVMLYLALLLHKTDFETLK